MAGFDFDLFVIGGGSGGVRAARVAAEAGARVALAEEYRFGGTCVIRGCVPKKLLVHASGFPDAFEDATGFGWRVGDVGFDWPALIAAKDTEIARLEAAYRSRLERAGVTLFAARATVTDAHGVRLSTGAAVSAKHLLVATGGRPVRPAFPGAELGVTSNEMFDLPALPPRVAVVGGGYVACEFAGILNGLGSRVLQFYRGEQILRGFDDAMRDHVADAMRDRGIGVQVGCDIAALERVAGGIAVRLDNGDSHVVDLVLLATGRHPNTDGLGLEAVGVRLGRHGAVDVDRWSQTSVPSIYAVGDVTGRPALTPVAIADGHAFADTVFGGRPRAVDHGLVPTAIFTRPEAATVGLSEAAASAQGPVEIYEARFRPLASMLAGRMERTLMKLVVDGADRRVLGVHLVGPGSGELIQLAAVAVRLGATKDDFDATLAVHPTAAEELVTLGAPVRVTS